MGLVLLTYVPMGWMMGVEHPATKKLKWQDEKLLRKHWQLVDETLGEEDGV